MGVYPEMFNFLNSDSIKSGKDALPPYVSVNSKPDHPPSLQNPQEIFLIGEFPTQVKHREEKAQCFLGLSDKAKIALFSKLSNFYFDLRPPGQSPGQDRGAKTRPQGQVECANPRGSPGGWSGLELTDTRTC